MSRVRRAVGEPTLSLRASCKWRQCSVGGKPRPDSGCTREAVAQGVPRLADHKMWPQLALDFPHMAPSSGPDWVCVRASGRRPLDLDAAGPARHVVAGVVLAGARAPTWGGYLQNKLADVDTPTAAGSIPTVT